MIGLKTLCFLVLAFPCQTYALIFPFRIQYFAWKDDDNCRPRPAGAVDTTYSWSLEGKDDGKCNNRHHTFKALSFSKNSTPFGRHMKHFGVCDIEIFQDQDCEGDTLLVIEGVNDREMEEWKCWDWGGDEARSLKVNCRKE